MSEKTYLEWIRILWGIVIAMLCGCLVVALCTAPIVTPTAASDKAISEYRSDTYAVQLFLKGIDWWHVVKLDGAVKMYSIGTEYDKHTNCWELRIWDHTKPSNTHTIVVPAYSVTIIGSNGYVTPSAWLRGNYDGE